MNTVATSVLEPASAEAAVTALPIRFSGCEAWHLFVNVYPDMYHRHVAIWHLEVACELREGAQPLACLARAKTVLEGDFVARRLQH